MPRRIAPRYFRGGRRGLTWNVFSVVGGGNGLRDRSQYSAPHLTSDDKYQEKGIIVGPRVDL